MDKLTVYIDTEEDTVELEVEYKIWPGYKGCHTQRNGDVGWPDEPPELEWYVASDVDVPDSWTDQIESQIWDHAAKQQRDEPQFDHERDYECLRANDY